MAKQKRNPYEGQRGVKDGRWTREMHEQAAIRGAQNAQREVGGSGQSTRHPGPGQCSPSTAYSVARANRDIAQARVHLSAIGPAEGKRTRKLWALVSKVQRQVDQANNYIAKCVGLNGLSGRRRR